MRSKDIKVDGTTRYELDGFGLRGTTGVVTGEAVGSDGKRKWKVLVRARSGRLPQYEATCTSREIIREVQS